LKSPIIGGGAG